MSAVDATAEILRAARARRAEAFRLAQAAPAEADAEPVRFRPTPAEIVQLRTAAAAACGLAVERVQLKPEVGSWQVLLRQGLELGASARLRLEVGDRYAARSAPLGVIALRAEAGRLTAIEAAS